MSHQVTVLMAHFRCEEWVAQAAESILVQTGVVPRLWVVDDASPNPRALLDALRPLRCESLRLWRSKRNVGQFRLYNRLLPAVETPYIALQDADDWSSPNRLETLVRFATTNEIDIVGSSATSVLSDGAFGEVQRRPHNVNSALRWRCRGPVVLGATLLCRTDFLSAIGGYDGSTRLGADSDLVYRAVFAGRVANVAETLYFARQREDSLTQAPATGFQSPERRLYRRAIRTRFYKNRLKDLTRRLRPEDLRAKPNDIEFDLEEVW
jgi:glycosyltransferase involved in cell wall biosynthesis